MEDCIFCKIVAGEAPAVKVLETDAVVAFENIKPAAPVHVLVVPKKHVAMLADTADAQLLGEMLLAVKQVAQKMGISDAFRVGILNGEKAGQSVFHLHFHVLGGWKGEPPEAGGL